MPRGRKLLIAADGELVVERDPQRAGGRLLQQAGMDASYVDLADPRHLEFSYLRWTRLILHAHRARGVLHVGGAACTLARALLAEDPDSRHEVVEVDPHVLDVARAHLGLHRQAGLRVRVADGREELESRAARPAPARLDAIVIDAFIGARVPRHLVTAQALRTCARLAPLTVINVVDTAGWGDARAIAAGLGEAYAHVHALGSGSRRGGNVVLFGGAEPPPRQLEGAAAADPAPARLLSGADLAGSAAWTDPDQGAGAS
jgi:hypothetical protein